MRPETTRALARGCQLYNDGLYWESHEAWEEAWLEEDGDIRQLLQGLIQVAAGFFKATEQRQANGCVKLLRSGLEKLVPLGPSLCGIELERFRAQVATALEAAERWKAGEREELAASLIPPLVRVDVG